MPRLGDEVAEARERVAAAVAAREALRMVGCGGVALLRRASRVE